MSERLFSLLGIPILIFIACLVLSHRHTDFHQ